MQAEIQATTRKSGRDSLARKAGILVISRAVTIIAQLFSIVILTRRLSVEDFSLISFLLLAYSTVLTLGQLGLPDSIFYFFEKVGGKSRKAFAMLTAKLLFLISIAGSIILLVIEFVAPLGGRELNGLLFPFMLLLMLELPTIPMPNILIAIDRTNEAGLFNIFVGVTQFLALVVPAVLGYSVSYIVYSLLSYGLLRFLLSSFFFVKNFRKEKCLKLPHGIARTVFRYSIPLSIAVTFWGLNRQIDKYIVDWFLDDISFAKYIIGAWEIPFLPTIAYSVAAVMMPQLVSFYLKQDKSGLLKLWLQSIKKVSIILVPLVVMFLVTSEEFITLFFSKKYIEAAVPFRIYTIIIIHRVASYSSLLRAIDETRTITYSAIYLLVINIALSIPFVLLLGMAGPPLATLIASFFTWGYILNKIKLKLKVSLGEVFPFHFYFKTLVTAFVSAIPVLFVKFYLEFPNGIKFVTLILCYLVTYGIVASLAGVIKKEDWLRLFIALKLKVS